MSSTSSPSRSIRFDQTLHGFAKLQRHLISLEPEAQAILVVMAATGTAGMRLATHLLGAGLPVSVIHPAPAHDFAKAVLKRSKTDAIAAQTLAALAARLQPARWTPPPAVFPALHQRLVHRDALVDTRTRFRNQLHALEQQPVVIAAIRTRREELISLLAEEIAELEAEIASGLQQDAAWAAAAARLAPITGLGTLTLAWILAASINFALTDTPEAAANYAGLAPRLRSSGTSVRGRASSGQGGHARVREALYMATRSALQHTPVIRTCYQRLLAAGKPKQVAVCAASRQVLRIAWAVGTKATAFDPG